MIGAGGPIKRADPWPRPERHVARTAACAHQIRAGYFLGRP